MSEADPPPESAIAAEPIDPAMLERDLDAVDAALAALDAGTYGVDQETGEPIEDDLLAADPTRLRN